MEYRDEENNKRLYSKYRGEWIMRVRCPYCNNTQFIKTVTFTCKYCSIRIDLRTIPRLLTSIILDVYGPTGMESEAEKIAHVRTLLHGRKNKPIPWM